MLIIDEQVKGCDLGRVEFETPSFDIEYRIPGRPPTRVSTRLFIPTKIDGLSPFEFTAERVGIEFECAAAGQGDFWLSILSLLALYAQFQHDVPKFDERERNARRFSHQTLEHSPTHLEILKQTQSLYLSPQERLLRLTGKTSDPTETLFRRALFQKPDFEFPGTDDQYLRCRNALLTQFCNRNAEGRGLDKADLYREQRADGVEFQLIRAVYREAEDAWLALLHATGLAVYRKARAHMTAWEKRAFALLFLRQDVFDGRIAFWDPVIMSFFLGMDDDTRALIVSALSCRHLFPENSESMGRDVAELWRAFLRLYPAWLVNMRGDEAEEKTERTRARPFTDPRIAELEAFATKVKTHLKTYGVHSSIPVDVPPLDLKGVSAENAINAIRARLERFCWSLLDAGPEESHRSDFDGFDVERWIRRYCTPQQAGVLILYFIDRQTEVEIAQILGTSQQAVGALRRRAMERLKAGLGRAGIVGGS